MRTGHLWRAVVQAKLVGSAVEYPARWDDLASEPASQEVGEARGEETDMVVPRPSWWRCGTRGWTEVCSRHRSWDPPFYEMSTLEADVVYAREVKA
jgi:hypothetical protein